MTLFDSDERNDLRVMSGIMAPRHGLQASNSRDSTHRAAPTVIIPGLGRNASSSPSYSYTGGPWSGKTLKDNLHTPRGQDWNPGGSTLSKSHSNKKQKTHHPPPGPASGERSRPRARGSSPRNQPRKSGILAHDVFEIMDDDDDDEDLGEVVARRGRSPDDPILLTPESARHEQRRQAQPSPTIKSKKPVVFSAYDDTLRATRVEHPVASGSGVKRRPSSPIVSRDIEDLPLAADGPNRTRLSHCHLSRNSSSESIRSWSEEVSDGTHLVSSMARPRHSTPGILAIPNHIVTQRASGYGKQNRAARVTQQTPTLHIDFNKPPPPRRSVVLAMQNKQQRDHIATAPTTFTSGSGKGQPAKKVDSPLYVAIGEGYVGTQYIGQSPERLLCYTGKHKKISVLANQDLVRGEETHELTFTLDIIERLEICQDPNSQMLRFTLAGPNSKLTINHPVFKDFCQSKHEGDRTFILKCSAESQAFSMLCSALRNAVNVCTTLHPSAAKSVWELQYKDAGQASHSPMFEPPTPPAITTRTVKKPQQYARSERNARPMDEGTDVHAQLARRSTRRSRVDAPIQEPKPSTLVPQPNDDELILVHPAGAGTGSIHITRGDRRRLEPGEFLNDTLIELGLRLWMDELRQTSPELVEQIHVFSSFFYNKLTSVPKNKPQEGYATVRKWTSKFDLFEKRYIIVPINENLHWYLAIICDPEHVLQPPPPKVLSLPPQTRRRRKDEAFGDPDTANLALDDASATGTTDDVERQEVDRMLNGASSQDDGLPDSLVLVDLPSEAGTTTPTRPSPPLREPSSPPLQIVPVRKKEKTVIAVEASAASFYEASKSGSASSSSLHGTTSTPTDKGKQKEGSPIVDIDGDVEMGDPHLPPLPEVAPTHPRTDVFTLDSLGSKHAAVERNLARYLQFEAEDKRKTPFNRTTAAHGCRALVPTQPNWCDCGLYLIFFVRQFFSNPDKYRSLVLDKDRSTTERREAWLEKDAGNMREQFARRIDELSAAWLQTRPDKSQAAGAVQAVPSVVGAEAEAAPITTVEGSDDEVQITGETIKAVPTPRPRKSAGGAKRKGKQREAESEDYVVEGKSTGKAERLR